MFNNSELHWKASTPPSLSQPYLSHDESSYSSLIFGTYSPNSPAYSNNLTDYGISVGMLKFWVQGMATTTLVTLGLIGNIVSIIVLSSPRMRNPSTCFLLCLSVCDSVSLIGGELLIGIPSLLAYQGEGKFTYNSRLIGYVNAIPSVAIFVITQTACSASTYYTMALTLERYLAVCRPIYAKYWSTCRRTGLVSLITISFAILYNLPRWWGYTYVIEETKNNLTLRRPAPTHFRAGPTLDTYYYHVGYFAFMFIGPIFFLIVFNVLICRRIRQANNFRKDMSPSTKHDERLSLSRMLFGVVIVFLLCQLVPAYRAFYRYVVGSREYVAGAECWWFLMLMLNASVNFLIYFVAGTKFRKVFCSMLCGWGRGRNNFQQLSSMTPARRTTPRSLSSQSGRGPSSSHRHYSGCNINGTK